MASERLIKIGKTPGRITELVVAEGTSVAEALEIAELSADGYDIKADGQEVGMEADASAFNIILLVKKIKGNLEKIIKVGKTPGRIQEVAVDSEMTAQELFDFAELDPEGYDIKADGETIGLRDIINGYSLILLVKKIKGNK